MLYAKYKIPDSKRSLSKDYIYALKVISTVVLLLSVLLAVYGYISFEKDRMERYRSEAEKITLALESSFDYISSLSKFLGEKIIQSGKTDQDTIAYLLKLGHVSKNSTNDGLLTWTLYDFINAEGYVVASTTKGVINPPIKILEKNRSWLAKTKANPWNIYIDPPDYGITSGSYTLPIGYGLSDESGRFIGILSLGLDIRKVYKEINNHLSYPSTRYLILSNSGQYLFGSEINKSDEFKGKDILAALAGLNLVNSGKFSKPIKVHNSEFYYFIRLQPYNYIILVGEDPVLMKGELIRKILPSIFENITLGIFFMIILYYFSSNILKSLRLVVNKAISLADGNLALDIPQVDSLEVNTLSAALMHIKETIKQEQKKVYQRTKDLENALTAKTDFLNNMSHEVRTPIQGFTAISQGLVDHWEEFSDQKKFELAENIAKNAKRLLVLVSNLLDLSKINIGRMELFPAKTELLQLIEEMISECHSLYIINQKIKIKFENNSITEAYAIVDQEKITQTLRNLLANAIKFTKEGTIVISINKAYISYEDMKQYDAWRIAISDQGVGIPQDELEKIFEPFYQSTRTKTRAGGTGLGLAICNKIIEMHHGKIWAENNAEKGAVFNFVIPAAKSQMTDDSEIIAHEYGSNSSDTTRDNLPKYNVVLIDDEEVCLMSMGLLLFDTNYKLVTANGGKVGLAYLKTHYDQIDLVLLDLMMPDMYGINLLNEIKKDPLLQDLPVMLQSGVYDETEIEKGNNLGAVAFIKKPYQREVILKTLDAYVALNNITPKTKK